MKCFFSACCVGILGCLFFPSTIIAKQPVANLIGTIQKNENVPGAGCSLYRKGKPNSTLFWSSLDRKSALMNIDGKDRTLKLVSDNQSSGREKKGDRSTSIYKNGKINVRIERVVTFVCPRGSQECEATGYDSKIKLSNGNRQQTLSVEGDCGS